MSIAGLAELFERFMYIGIKEVDFYHLKTKKLHKNQIVHLPFKETAV